MGRIRTIKPDFPQSESMGRISREARLCFILLWTHVDDSGRARASSRMLASLLYPYDDDAAKKIEGWLSELEGEACLIRYSVQGNSYLQICNWLIHQKIDKPSASKIPPFDESSRILANPLESSTTDVDVDVDVDKEDTLSGKPDVVRHVNGYRPKAEAILKFLNEKCNRAFQGVDSNIKLIVARLKEGYTEDELRQIIVRRSRDWLHDDKMSQYLRPETLFNATKCAQYRGELV